MSLINLDTHSRGGLDVTLAINLFFKGVLLFPIFLFAIYTGTAMMKHMIFHGIPVMNSVTEEQQELLRNRDHSIGIPPDESDTRDYSALPPRPVLEAPAAIDPSAIELLNPATKEELLPGQRLRMIRQHCELTADVNRGSYYICDNF